MTAPAEKIYELVKTMPEEQAREVLDFVEFLKQKTRTKTTAETPKEMPQGTLTGLRGIAKRSGQTLTDEELLDDYTNYLSQKYQ